MSKIVQMDAQLSNMIAAGEVVERPSGIVKELVENAMDAGARQISVEIEEGGISLIRVSDDGEGMDSQDATLAFMRHATSKIKRTQDLWNITSLGFRGEALPSIASVACVECETSNGEESTQVKIEYGQIQSARPFPSNQGTRLTVTKLFHKMPARLKHLKSPQYEASLVQDVMNKFALSHPEIAFELISEGRVNLSTTGSGNLQEVCEILYGSSTLEQAIPLSFSDYDYKVEGIAFHPSMTRATRNYIQVFINGRMVKDYRLTKAILTAYAPYVPSERYPMVVLHITMDPHLVDVNVHPSKWEVRLSKQQQLEHLILEQMKQALSHSMQAPQIQEKGIKKEKVEMPTLDLDSFVQAVTSPLNEKPQAFDFTRHEPINGNENKQMKASEASVPSSISQETSFEIGVKESSSQIQNFVQSGNSVQNGMSIQEPGVPYGLPQEPSILHENPAMAESMSDSVSTRSKSESHTDIADINRTRTGQGASVPSENEVIPANPQNNFPPLRYLAQMHGKYLLCEAEKGLYIIDQHAAQERVHYEELLQSLENKEFAMTESLVPYELSVSRDLIQRLDEINEACAELQIQFEPFSLDTVIVRHFPIWLKEVDLPQFFYDLLDRFKAEKEMKFTTIRKDVIATMACHRSIRFNRHLSEQEAREVIRQLSACSQPYHCPHGRPTFLCLTSKDLEKEFYR